MNKLIISFCLACHVLCSKAQHFKYKAQLPPIDSSSFYKVEIPPAIAGKSQPLLADVRILDNENKENPYIVKTSEAVFREKDFEELRIISRDKGADHQTYVIVENTNEKRLQHLLLFIKNTQAQRTAILSGSENQTNWYVIKENLELESLTNNGNYGDFLQRISFPPVDYRYLKITIAGKDVLPVNIIKAGISLEKSFPGKFVQLPVPVITTVDSSDKRTYVHIHFSDTYQVDKLELTIAGPKYYRRNIAFFPGNNKAIAPKEFVAASNVPTSFPVEVKAKDVLLVIENEDNPPLQVDAVKGWQLNKYLLTYLSKGESYTLLFGDGNSSAPAYDLPFFIDSIPPVLPVINPGNVEVNVASNNGLKDKKSGRPIILWIVIFAVLCLLLFACYKLITDLEKKKAEKDDTHK